MNDERGFEVANFNGSIFGGDLLEDGFYLTRVKHLETASNISAKQMTNLQNYLRNYSEQNESCTITVNDQIPVLLSAEEVKELEQELNQIAKQKQ